ncbi:hypothetical protein [Aquisalimonas asiatica]|uniref:Methyltransferase domain-containing protein n=1 Tax=Aquisalimonas asiatica TaxID=406100 RepID=A0A1H8RPE1_9GAMM|nr:hypothetical protein [Aquisalimonas asiatica]SEO68429.1 hypothetical protein SAMN04488052_102170 [Aquisalimonas asiatica]
MADVRRAGPTTSESPEPPFSAPLFQEWMGAAQAGERVVVLDIGPPRSANVDFFSPFRCRLGIGDALAELVAINGVEDRGAALSRLQAVLPESLFGGSDLILCWDLLDYLDANAIRYLASYLRALVSPGAALHAIVGYGVSSIPSSPVGYRLESEGLRRSPAPAGDPGRKPPRHSSGELQRLMPDWRVERSVLLRSGFQEYMLRC